MHFKPKTEPGSRPSGDVGDDKILINMSIPDLISELRIATRTKQFDQVEKVLVAREAQLKGEVEKMREILDCERLDRMKIEEELKKCEKQCERGKRAEELYEKLLAAVKKNGLEDGDMTVDELRTKNSKLERELEIWKKKFVELNERILRLGYDTQLLMMKGGNNEEDDGADLAVTFEVKEKKETNGIHVHGGNSGNNNADSTISQRNGDTSAGIGQSSSNPNKDASGIGILVASLLATLICLFEFFGVRGDCIGILLGKIFGEVTGVKTNLMMGTKEMSLKQEKGREVDKYFTIQLYIDFYDFIIR